MKDRDVDQAVRDFVRDAVDLPDDGLDRALATAKRTTQERRGPRWWPVAWFARSDSSTTGVDHESPEASTRSRSRVPLAGLAAGAVSVVILAVLAGMPFGDDEPALMPAASGAPPPTASAPSCLPSAGGPAGGCPVVGSADITNTTRSRSTILPIRTVGSSFEGPGEPFELNFENESNELEVRGIAEPGQFRADPRFFLGGQTSDVGWDTADGSDCMVMISFVNAWSISGGFSCDDHASTDPESPVDLSGTFEASIAERGAASAYRSDSYMEGFDQMFSFDSALFFDGRLETADAQFPDGPMHLLFRSDDGSTMEVTGTTREGTFTEDDGFTIVVEDHETEYFDLDANNSDCTIEVEQSDETRIQADFTCRFVGREVGGTFEAIP